MSAARKRKTKKPSPGSSKTIPVVHVLDAAFSLHEKLYVGAGEMPEARFVIMLMDAGVGVYWGRSHPKVPRWTAPFLVTLYDSNRATGFPKYVALWCLERAKQDLEFRNAADTVYRIGGRPAMREWLMQAHGATTEKS